MLFESGFFIIMYQNLGEELLPQFQMEKTALSCLVKHLQNTDTSNQSLAIGNIRITLLIWTIGLLLAVVCYIVEWITFNKPKLLAWIEK